MFRPDGDEKSAFLNSSCLKSVFEKICLRDGLVWTEGLTVETKLRCHVFTLPYKLSHRVPSVVPLRTTKGEGEGEGGVYRMLEVWSHTYIGGMDQNFEVKLS